MSGTLLFTLDELDDLAVLVLISAFESMVRIRVLTEVRNEESAIRHSVLIEAVQEAIQRVEEGSFYWVIKPFKRLDHDLVEEVNKVRQYRNWVAHGRRGSKPPTVEPRIAYARLSRFWSCSTNLPSRRLTRYSTSVGGPTSIPPVDLPRLECPGAWS